MTQSQTVPHNKTENKMRIKPQTRSYFKTVFVAVVDSRIIDGSVVELVKYEKINPVTHCVMETHYIVRTNNYYGQKFNDLKAANEALEEGDMPTLFPPHESEMWNETADHEA